MKPPDRWRVVPCRRCGGKGEHRLVSGAWLRAARERAGLSKRQVAEGMGVSVTYVWDLEHDVRDAPPKLAMRYLEAVK